MRKVKSGGWIAAGVVSALSVIIMGPTLTLITLGGGGALVLITRYSRARLGWFIGGALLVFGGSDSVGAPKIAYLAGLALVAAISAVRVFRSDAAWLVPFRPMVPGSVMVLAVIAASGLVAVGHSPPEAWLRDAAPYLMLSVAPLIGLDSAHDVREGRLHGLIAALGVATAVGFAVDWLDRRGVSSLPFGRLILATGAPAVLALGFALAKISARERVARWGLLAAVIPSVMLTTGTRSIVTYGAMLFGVVGSRDMKRIGVGRTAFLGVMTVSVIALLAPGLAGLLGDSAFFERRVEMAMAAAQGRARGDGSFQERGESYAVAWRVWAEHRWWGVGPGALGTMDTPVITLAKFGLIGTAAFLAFLVILLRCGSRAGRVFGWTPAHTAVRCFAFAILASIPLGSRLEDKGFSLAVALAVCALAAAAQSRFTVGHQFVPSEVVGIESRTASLAVASPPNLPKTDARGRQRDESPVVRDAGLSGCPPSRRLRPDLE